MLATADITAMHAKTIAIVTVSAAVLAAVLMYGSASDDGATAASVAPAAGRSLSSYFNLGASASSAPAAVPAFASLSARLELLAASGTPEDAYAAYSLLDDCIMFQAEGRLAALEFERGSEMTAEEKAAEAQLCGSMTQRQKDSRLDFLLAAAKGGVAGASSIFLREGPFGDPHALRDRPGDPLVLEWKQQALALLTERAGDGELAGINTLMVEYLNGGDLVQKDAALAYRYLLTMRLVFDDILVPGATNPYQDSYWQGLRDQLTPEQQAAALDKANRMAAKYRQHAGQAAHG